MEIWGHRGQRGSLRENHWEAFEAAWQAGAHGIELDVWANAEGEAVVLHDATLQRTHGLEAHIHTLLTAQCTQHDIPLLSAVIARYANKGRLNIEIKDPLATERVAQLLKGTEAIKVGGHPQYLVSSFYPEILADMQQRLPSLALGFITETLSTFIVESCAKRQLWSIHPQVSVCTATWINRCHQIGLQVIPWTVNLAHDAQFLAQSNAFALITDVPEQALAWKRN